MQIDEQIKALRAWGHRCTVCQTPYAPCDDMYHCRGCYDMAPHNELCEAPACVVADLLVELKNKLAARYGTDHVMRDRALSEAQEILARIKL